MPKLVCELEYVDLEVVYTEYTIPVAKSKRYSLVSALLSFDVDRILCI